MHLFETDREWSGGTEKMDPTERKITKIAVQKMNHKAMTAVQKMNRWCSKIAPLRFKI